MVSIIVGNRGSGKTKQLIALVNAAVEQSNGNVICIEKKPKLTYDVSSRARLAATDDYVIEGYDAFYGFLCGICAGDHDITDIFVDAALRIGGRDFGQLAAFLRKLRQLADTLDKNVVLTVSADEAELPSSVFDAIQ
ncbi:MAG: hypothetical protein LBJ11_11285 [Oscillospiraceae bacterium]|jgi:ABC-type molybdenum transport system ATPase subunit/photorepair protein PhrA|nr:hypothetical protein [Oscillospiraceae bacterium]